MDKTALEEPIPMLDLNTLGNGFRHIPRDCGSVLAQAVAVCLEENGHPQGVTLKVEGDFVLEFKLAWPPATDPMRRYWSDLDEAVEQGAYGLAILLIRRLTKFTVIERSRKGTGFDWWLGEDDCLFQAKARLEVSGILKGTNRQVDSRLAVKRKQTRQSDETGLPVYIAIVEFGTPRTKLVDQ